MATRQLFLPVAACAVLLSAHAVPSHALQSEFSVRKGCTTVAVLNAGSSTDLYHFVDESTFHTSAASPGDAPRGRLVLEDELWRIYVGAERAWTHPRRHATEPLVSGWVRGDLSSGSPNVPDAQIRLACLLPLSPGAAHIDPARCEKAAAVVMNDPDHGLAGVYRREAETGVLVHTVRGFRVGWSEHSRKFEINHPTPPYNVLASQMEPTDPLQGIPVTNWRVGESAPLPHLMIWCVEGDDEDAGRNPVIHVTEMLHSLLFTLRTLAAGSIQTQGVSASALDPFHAPLHAWLALLPAGLRHRFESIVAALVDGGPRSALSFYWDAQVRLVAELQDAHSVVFARSTFYWERLLVGAQQQQLLELDWSEAGVFLKAELATAAGGGVAGGEPDAASQRARGTSSPVTSARGSQVVGFGPPDAFVTPADVLDVLQRVEPHDAGNVARSYVRAEKLVPLGLFLRQFLSEQLVEAADGSGRVWLPVHVRDEWSADAAGGGAGEEDRVHWVPLVMVPKEQRTFPPPTNPAASFSFPVHENPTGAAESVAGVLTVSRCEYNEEYLRTVADFMNQMRERQLSSIVLDLRGNAGGDSRVITGFLDFVRPWQLETRAPRYFGSTQRDSPIRKAFLPFYDAPDVQRRWQSFKLGAQWRLPASEIQWLLETSHAALAGTNCCPRRVSMLLQADCWLCQDAVPEFTGSIVVLTDKKTFSAAAQFATVLAESGVALTIGQPWSNARDFPGNQVTTPWIPFTDFSMKQATAWNSFAAGANALNPTPDVGIATTGAAVHRARDDVLDAALRLAEHHKAVREGKQPLPALPVSLQLPRAELLLGALHKPSAAAGRDDECDGALGERGPRKSTGSMNTAAIVSIAFLGTAVVALVAIIVLRARRTRRDDAEQLQHFTPLSGG